MRSEEKPNCESCGAECAAKRYSKEEIQIAYECLYIDKGSYWQKALNDKGEK